MPFQRPTLQQLIDRLRAALESRLEGIDPFQRRSLVRVLSEVQAGGVTLLHGHLDYQARQFLPDTCDEDELPRFGLLWDVPRKTAAPARGSATVTGLEAAVIVAGTQLQSATGQVYTTEAEAIITGGSAIVEVTAVEAGTAGNLEAGAKLSLISPIAGVSSTATVAAGGLAGGTDIEPVEAWRARIIDEIRAPTNGGSADDYVRWAKEVRGVTRGWCEENAMGAGTVTVRFMMDDTYPHGIPQPVDVEAVRAHIDARRPVGMAGLFVVAPTAVPLDMTIALRPNIASVRAAAEAEITDLLRRLAVPGGTIPISKLREAVSTAEGEDDHAILSHASDITHAAGEVAVPGVITWQDL